MALAGMGQAFSGSMAYLCCRVFGLVRADRQLPPRFYRSSALPVGLLMAANFCLANTVYLYLTVSFVAMLKALQPAVTMLGLFMARLETPSRRLILSVCLIAVGTGLTSVGELNFSAVGLAIMLLSMLTEASRLVMTQLLLVGLNFHPVEGLMYLAPSCTLWLLLGSLAFEVRSMRATGAFAFVARHPAPFLAAAALGFLVNWLNYVVIKKASALTLKVLGPVKNALVVLSGMVLLHDTVTPLQFIGYSVSLAAFVWYNMIKMQQGSPGKPPPTPTLPSYDTQAGQKQFAVLDARGGAASDKHIQ
ncbi:hypothetical protein N2152v2_010548 [Parachlorella kessleri]